MPHSCRSDIKRLICNKRHYAVLCFKLPLRSGLETENVSIENSTTASSSSSNILANQACTSEEFSYRLLWLCCKTETIGVYSKTKMYRHKCYNICLTDIDNYYTCNLNVYDQEIICNDVPSIRHGPWINELKNRKISLSDSGHKLGGKIEILLGADVAGKLLTRIMFYLKSGPVAIKTILGWTLMGKTNRNETKFDKNHFMNVTSMFVNDMCISDLWKLDSLGITNPVETKTKLEIQKETLNHFQKTISVDISGRYEVALPWVLDNKLLSSNRKLAENRLESTKRKLIATGKFDEYQDVLDLWLSGKISEEVNDDKENFVHYLPHRPVIKENSTSKIRPVFDASTRTKGSPSLNDCLEKGPNFIEVIPTILNHFRKYKIGVISDIEKAFLRIGVREQDRDFLRFMWYDRENRDRNKIYRHRRVVFGVTSSPFLLGAILNHHLDNAHGNFDKVAKILRKSFYVDNCVISFETEEQLQKFIVESKISLSSAHFNLRGWQSNVLLNPEKFSELESQPNNFDTMEICKLKLKWDENLPKDILNQVKKWLKQLPILADIKIPRCLNLSSNGIKRLTLHVFCDPSKKAYATCVFLRVEYEENVFVKLIQAKARVAPLKDISIPRLELLSCTIGTRLAASVKNDLNLPDVHIYYLTDSMTAAQQLRKRFRIEYLGQLREQTQYHRKLRPLTVGEVVVVENSLKNRTLWSLARVIQLIPGKDGHVRVARVKTETGELVRPVQRLYNLELQEPEINLPKDLTDSVIRTRRGRKQENSKVGECCESTKERRGDRPDSTQGVKGLLTRGEFREQLTYYSTIVQCSPLGCTSCLGKRAQKLQCRGLERVAWSDESRFRLLNADGRLRIWRQAHEAIDPACQVGTVQGYGGSIVVWGVFSWQFLGSVVRVPTSLNAIRYVE
ncbi:integrase catalytic domain-containing protein [Trichonephila clavipes]|nr:integrase catalytic domain-containing protein [Trichonephila clavipes]